MPQRHANPDPDHHKRRQLTAHKRLATGLFLVMVLVYAAMVWLGRHQPAGWIGYVQAFAEAGMVGALADWFAVTALFHHPLGLPIPHTNLIERGKAAIGANLGDFVVSNFLNAATIRPYIAKLNVSGFAAAWLGREKNTGLLIQEGARLALELLRKTDEAQVAAFVAKRGGALLQELRLHIIVSNALGYFLDRRSETELVTLLARKVSGFIAENETLVREKVKAESPFFVPGFVDRKLAERITSGLVAYFEEIASDPAHRIREELRTQLYHFASQLRTEPRWETEFRDLSASFLTEEKLFGYALAAWRSLKATLEAELQEPDSALARYLRRNLDEFQLRLEQDEQLQARIDGWIRHTAYRYILRNATQVSTLISSTIGNWPGRELSRKLELEVGKDLQFIRINGTIVGGAVGLLIYALTRLFE